MGGSADHHFPKNNYLTLSEVKVYKNIKLLSTSVVIPFGWNADTEQPKLISTY